tara:strand:+ start:250 stop:423 length:174 start_codon:yes stop_codon:yes gene_type:complete
MTEINPPVATRRSKIEPPFWFLEITRVEINGLKMKFISAKITECALVVYVPSFSSVK